jgi:hypothetical protein
MTARQIFGTIRKRQTEVGATDTDLMLAAGLSPKQWRSRVNDPGKFRLLELEGISNYLGLRFTAHR